jgi:hypothetical protein
MLILGAMSAANMRRQPNPTVKTRSRREIMAKATTRTPRAIIAAFEKLVGSFFSFINRCWNAFLGKRRTGGDGTLKSLSLKF